MGTEDNEKMNNQYILDFKDEIFRLAECHLGFFAVKITKNRFEIVGNSLSIFIEIMIFDRYKKHFSPAKDIISVHITDTKLIGIEQSFLHHEIISFINEEELAFRAYFFEPIIKAIYKLGVAKK